MTIQEITDLRKLENENELRLPIRAQKLSQDECKHIYKIFYYMSSLTQFNEKNSSLILKSILIRFPEVISIKGVGTRVSPFKIQTQYGCGEFFNARLLFEDGKYPINAIHGCCFMNCYNMALKLSKENCSILSGIAFKGKRPFLHSVIKIGDKIIDLNYDMCIDAELYYGLFNFEVLSEVNSIVLVENCSVIEKYQKFLHEKGFSHLYANFALEALINYLEDENRDENIEIALK